MDHKSLSVVGATYQYEGSDWRLQSASFSVNQGEIIGIIGPNGSGKSTPLKIAARIFSSKDGKVRLEGKDLAQMRRREIARYIGYLPQNVESHFDYTVKEVVAMGRYPHQTGTGFMTAQDVSVVSRCLVQTETDSYQDRTLNQLSGGERQRALLASVIAQEPKFLLLDEPTSALDINHQIKFFKLLSKLVEDGIGAAVVTHDLNLASLFSDRLLLMKDGKIVNQGDPQTILNKDILSEIYGEGIEVVQHPSMKRPMVLPTTDIYKRK